MLGHHVTKHGAAGQGTRGRAEAHGREGAGDVEGRLPLDRTGSVVDERKLLDARLTDGLAQALDRDRVEVRPEAARVIHSVEAVVLPVAQSAVRLDREAITLAVHTRDALLEHRKLTGLGRLPNDLAVILGDRALDAVRQESPVTCGGVELDETLARILGSLADARPVPLRAGDPGVELAVLGLQTLGREQHDLGSALQQGEGGVGRGHPRADHGHLLSGVLPERLVRDRDCVVERLDPMRRQAGRDDHAPRAQAVTPLELELPSPAVLRKTDHLRVHTLHTEAAPDVPGVHREDVPGRTRVAVRLTPALLGEAVERIASAGHAHRPWTAHVLHADVADMLTELGERRLRIEDDDVLCGQGTLRHQGMDEPDCGRTRSDDGQLFHVDVSSSSSALLPQKARRSKLIALQKWGTQKDL